MPNTSPATSYTIRRATVQVPSLTNPAKSYTVSLDPKDGEPVDCTCPDATHRRRRCKHQTEAAAGRCTKPRLRVVVGVPPACPHGRRPTLCAACVPMPSAADLYGD